MLSLILITTVTAIGVVVAFLLRSLDATPSDYAVSYSSLPSIAGTTSTKPAMLNAAFSIACDLAMRDFIYSWWRQYTDDELFPNHVRGLVAQAFRVLSEDLSRLNWAVLFRQYAQIIRDKVVDSKPVVKATDSSSTSIPLPLLNTSDCSSRSDSVYLDYCRQSLRRILQHLLPQETTVNLMLQELLISTVMMPFLALLQPASLNQMLLDYLNSDSEAIHCVISEWIEAQTRAEKESMESNFQSEKGESSAILPQKSSSPLKVNIVRAILKFDPKPFIVYSIEVRYGQSYWEICRRYNDFTKLHSQLRQQVGLAFSGQLPKRNFRDRFKKVFVETRQLDLHRYLQQILSCPECLQTATLFEWLTPRSSDLVSVASPVGQAAPKDHVEIRRSSADGGPVLFKDSEILDSEDPNLRFLISDIMTLFKSFLGRDISFRTKTGYRILYIYAPRSILKEVRKFTFNDIFSRILVWITTTVWPNGVLVESCPSNATLSEEECKQLQLEIEKAILRIIPKSVIVILGQTACEKLVKNFIRSLNDKERLSEAVCVMLETTVDRVVSQRKPNGSGLPKTAFSAA